MLTENDLKRCLVEQDEVIEYLIEENKKLLDENMQLSEFVNESIIKEERECI